MSESTTSRDPKESARRDTSESSNREDRPANQAPTVARIPYLNAAPFYYHWGRLETGLAPWRSRDLVPRHLGIAAERGEVDAGLMAVADLLRLRATFEPLAIPARPEPRVFGIANRERVDSVLLFLREELGGWSDGRESPGTAAPHASVEPLLARDHSIGRDLGFGQAARLDRRPIAITGESSTSFRLLRLLLEARFGIRPSGYTRLRLGEEPAPEHAAALVIGDQALRWRVRPPRGFRQAMDLATSWFAWTGAPFVFAVWGVRRTLAEDRKTWLGEFLADSLDAARPRLDDLAGGLPSDLGTTAELRVYLDNFIYELGPEEHQAARRFEALLSDHGIDCTAD